MDSWWEAAQHQGLSSVLCDDLGWGGRVGGGRPRREVINVYLELGFMLLYSRETDTTLCVPNVLQF